MLQNAHYRFIIFSMENRKPGFFDRGGLLDRILVKANIVPDYMRDDLVEAAKSVARGSVITDGAMININGIGITDEDRKAYEESVAGIAERVFDPADGTEEARAEIALTRHRSLVEQLSIKQQAALSDATRKVPSTRVSVMALDYERDRNRRRREADKKREEQRKR